MQARRSWNVLVVDEDPIARDHLCGYLAAQGLEVAAAHSAAHSLQRLHRHRPDLVVMDAGPGDPSGLQVCQRLRAAGDRLPVILLGTHAEEIDRIVGLELGADDYLSRPCAPRELLARIHAVLRRTHPASAYAVRPAMPVPIGEWHFDLQGRSLVRGEDRQNLGTVEYALLSELVMNPGVVVSREQLVAAAHGREDIVLPRAVDAAVMRLRKRLEPQPARPRHLQTVRGQGYMFIAAAGRTGGPAPWAGEPSDSGRSPSVRQA